MREQPGTLQYRLPESWDWSRASPGIELQPGTTVHAGSSGSGAGDGGAVDGVGRGVGGAVSGLGNAVGGALGKR